MNSSNETKVEIAMYPFSTKEMIACNVAENPASLCSSPYLVATRYSKKDIKQQKVQKRIYKVNCTISDAEICRSQRQTWNILVFPSYLKQKSASSFFSTIWTHHPALQLLINHYITSWVSLRNKILSATTVRVKYRNMPLIFKIIYLIIVLMSYLDEEF